MSSLAAKRQFSFPGQIATRLIHGSPNSQASVRTAGNSRPMTQWTAEQGRQAARVLSVRGGSRDESARDRHASHNGTSRAFGGAKGIYHQEWRIARANPWFDHSPSGRLYARSPAVAHLHGLRVLQTCDESGVARPTYRYRFPGTRHVRSVACNTSPETPRNGVERTRQESADVFVWAPGPDATPFRTPIKLPARFFTASVRGRQFTSFPKGEIAVRSPLRARVSGSSFGAKIR